MHLKSGSAKIAWLIVIALLAAGGAFYLFGPTSPLGHSTASKSDQLYTCGMHPQVIKPKPENCPICGMKLTPIRKENGGLAGSGQTDGSRRIKFYKSTMNPGEISQTPAKDSMGMEMVPVYEEEMAGSSVISIDPVTIQNMGVRTTEVLSGPLRRVIRTVGVIDYDETMLADVTTKFRGWMEKLYVDAIGKQVHQSEPLFEIYSPELYGAQTEYILALGSSTNSNQISDLSLRESARLKLRFFDISEEQIAELERTRKPSKTLQVNSPINGFVVEKMAVEGMLAESGMKLYRLADLGIVWVHAQVYEQDLAYIQLGQEATVSLSYLPDRKFRGRVTYIYPTVDEKTRTAKVRMEFHNPGFFLKPGMFASVEVVAELAPSAVLVPDSAVLRSGDKNTVFVALEGGRFEPRTVALGLRAEQDRYQVLAGLSPGERVVTSGQFMLDSESQLREAIQKMIHPAALAAQGQTDVATHDHSAHLSREPAEQSEPGPPIYICPMPEHVAIEYEPPGKCPLCGMTLVPVSRETLAKIQPGGVVESYTCPMPEHVDVREQRSGKCPRCAMTLIPVMSKPKISQSPVPSPPVSPPPVSPPPVSPPSEPPADPGPSLEGSKPGKLYTCPMAIHADMVSDQPVKCPKCEMVLVETTQVKHAKQAEEHWRKQQGSNAPDKGESKH